MPKLVPIDVPVRISVEIGSTWPGRNPPIVRLYETVVRIQPTLASHKFAATDEPTLPEKIDQAPATLARPDPTPAREDEDK